MTETAPHENPLVPNRKLRQMYTAMAEARVLDEYIARLQRGVKARKRLGSAHGQEACRVSTAIELRPGDLVSDAQVGVAMDLLLGAKVEAVLTRLDGLVSKDKAAVGAGERQLPWVDDVVDRLKIAMGAAMAAKALKRKNIVVAYVRHREASGKQWRQVLTLAAKLDMPIIFVVLPEGTGKKKGDGTANLHTKSQAWGVPGIPVDASDAVALYRVSQESIGRTRGGGGPVLIECVSYRLEGAAEGAEADSVLQMRDFLLGRKVCDKAWLDQSGAALRARLEAARKK